MKKHFKSSFKRIMAFSLIVTMLATVVASVTVSAEENNADANSVDVNKNAMTDENTYFENYLNLAEIQKLSYAIELNAVDSNAFFDLHEYSGKRGVQLNATENYIEWTFEVAESGVASVEVEYMPITDKNTDLLIELTIDGKLPFREAESLYLPRLWKRDYTDDKTERPFDIDAQGNEIAPDQIQVSQWNKVFLADPQGLYAEPYLFYFEKGLHTVRLSAMDSTLILGKIVFTNPEYATYEEYYEKYSNKAVNKGEIVYQQAELTEITNSVSINPTYDKLNTATVPSNPTAIMLNTIGASNWSNYGDSISWKVNVPKEGMYRLAFRARQNVNSGLISYRSLYVNGEIPFSEAQNIPFTYSQDWQIYTLGGEEELLVYLKPGDLITLSCTTGETNEILRNIRKATNELNTLYRKVIAITSVSPDTFQDYKLEKKIAGIDERFADITKLLHTEAKKSHS